MMSISVRREGAELNTPDIRGGRRGVLPLVLAAALAVPLAEYILRVLSMPAQWVPLLLGGVFIACAVVVIGNTRKLLLVVILLGVPFSININLFYRDEMAAVNAIAGLYLSTTTMALVVLYILWFLEALARRPRDVGFAKLLRSDAVLLTFIGLVLVSALLAGDMKLGLFEVAQLVQYVLLYLYLRYAIRDRQDVKLVLLVLLAGLLAETFVMFALAVGRHDFSLMSITARIDANGRVGGTVGGPNGAGSYLTLLIVPALGVFFSRLPRVYKLLGFACFFTGIAALILTMSRGGWVGFGLSAMVFCFFALRRRWLSPVTVVGLAVGAVVVLLIFYAPIMTRLTAPDEGAAYARWPLMKIAGRMIADQPVLGVGANNFALHLGEYATGPLAAEWLSTVHNTYLLVWAESGIFALLAFLGFLAITVRRGWRGYRYNDPFLSPIALGLMAGVLGFMFHMLVDIFIDGNSTELFFVIAALLAVIDRLPQDEVMNDPESVGEWVIATDQPDGQWSASGREPL